ncbi:hypothetical protein MKW98_018034 [Papaver atlanticum]|uniref:Uncharacterized protein n=1 Tax=Papaver atlanticum TaxID=357466 RepID=A0AAD4TFG4_9MAGN|nr:hypothetical protein MKW98_018034 [Papaver atlanticum]
MTKYFKKYSLDEKSFRSDIARYSSLYVFSFGFAKLESPVYHNFMKSLNDDFCSKVYFGFNGSLILYTTEELEPGLHKIGIALDANDVGVLLTDKTREEVLSKFREYEELDFVKPVELGMPVELSDRSIKLTEKFTVCEDGVRVTENQAKILKCLGRKMFNFVPLPYCFWSRTTGQTEYFHLDLPRGG